MYSTDTFAVHRCQKGILGPLRLELQMPASCLAGAENRTQFLCRSNKTLNLWANLQVLILSF